MAPRDHVIKVRLSAAELALATANAEAEGVPLSTWLRRLAVAARPHPRAEDERVRRALAVLGSLTSQEADELRASVRVVRKGWSRGRR
jgi:hypothetical protein